MQTQQSPQDLHTKLLEKIAVRFHKETTSFLNLIQGPSTSDVEREGTWLLNRLLLLFFLQRRGFLCENLSYIHDLLKMTEGSFYQHGFLPLLRQLGEFHPLGEYKDLLGPIPAIPVFFDSERVNTKLSCLQIPDGAFAALFDCFTSYEWTLEEGEKPDVITPTILAHVVEKRLNGREGAYYTPSDVAVYITSNSILPSLVEKVREVVPEFFDPQSLHSIWWMLQSDPDRYIYDVKKKGVHLSLPPDIALGQTEVSHRTLWNLPASEAYALPGETWRDVVERRRVYEVVHERITGGHVTEISDFITYNLDLRRFLQNVLEHCTEPRLLLAFYEKLAGTEEEVGLSILDPTCGAGAFLLTALSILEPIYTTCLERMVNFVVRHPYNLNFFQMKKILAILDLERHHPNRVYFVRKQILLNNLYGVDLSEEAIDVTKLCLLLQLIATLSNGEDLQWLPDLDFTIHSGNALVGIATKEELSAVLHAQVKSNTIPHQSPLFTKESVREEPQTVGAVQLEQILEQLMEIERQTLVYRRLQMEHRRA